MNSMFTEELLNIKRGGIWYVACYDSSSEYKVPLYQHWKLLPSNNVHLYLWQLPHWELLSEVLRLTASGEQSATNDWAPSFWRDVHDKMCVVVSDCIKVSTRARANYVGSLPRWKGGVELAGIEECFHMPPRAFDRYWNTKLGNEFLFPISNSASKNEWTIAIPLQ